MENIRVIKERSELALYSINTEDTMYSIIEKINKNFAVIREYQGGRQGVPGLPGLPGCSGVPEFLNEVLDDNEQIVSSSDAKNLCLSIDSLNSEFIENDFEMMYNKWAHKPLILTNFSQLVDSSNNIGVVCRGYNEPDLSFPGVMDSLFDVKLSIFNSNNSGYGRHFNLVNSKAVVDDARYGCKSGFLFSSNKIEQNSNLEELVISGNKNESIENHRHKVILENNYSVVRRNKQSQELKLDAGSDEANEFSGRLQLQKQTKDNTYRLPDRTGWVGIWEDTLNSDEFWEYVSYTDVDISRINYKLISDGSQKITYSGEPMPISLTDKSIIRFKRLNNFVLLEFHINIKTTEISEDIMINNIKFDIVIPTIGCKTLIWSTGCYYNNGDIDADEFDSEVPNYFKIYNLNNSNGQTFGICVKNNPHLLLTNDTPTNDYFFDGQVWATVEDGNSVCEALIIVNDDSCERLKITN